MKFQVNTEGVEPTGDGLLKVGDYPMIVDDIEISTVTSAKGNGVKINITFKTDKGYPVWYNASLLTPKSDDNKAINGRFVNTMNCLGIIADTSNNFNFETQEAEVNGKTKYFVTTINGQPVVGTRAEVHVDHIFKREQVNGEWKQSTTKVANAAYCIRFLDYPSGDYVPYHARPKTNGGQATGAPVSNSQTKIKF